MTGNTGDVSHETFRLSKTWESRQYGSLPLVKGKTLLTWAMAFTVYFPSWLC